MLISVLVRFVQVCFFRSEDNDDKPLKTNITVYDNDTMVVTGLSYFLWTLTFFKVGFTT